jgi:hypothetical protein
MLSLLIGCMKLISKTICHHLLPELTAGAQITGKSHHIHHLSYSLDEVPPKFNFYLFLAMSQHDWPIMPKRKKLWRSPKIDGSTSKSSNSPLWPSYMAMKGGQHL